jgi:hypothetical protein
MVFMVLGLGVHDIKTGGLDWGSVVLGLFMVLGLGVQIPLMYLDLLRSSWTRFSLVLTGVWTQTNNSMFN